MKGCPECGRKLVLLPTEGERESGMVQRLYRCEGTGMDCPLVEITIWEEV